MGHETIRDTLALWKHGGLSEPLSVANLRHGKLSILSALLFHEHDAVEVVRLVLNTPSHRLGAFVLHWIPVTVLPPYDHMVISFHIAINTGYREASFHAVLHLLPDGLPLRVNNVAVVAASTIEDKES